MARLQHNVGSSSKTRTHAELSPLCSRWLLSSVRVSFDFKPEGSSDGGTAARYSKHMQAGLQLGNEERQQE